jgi:negative regulator of sigma E activity
VRLNSGLALRVSTAISSEPEVVAEPVRERPKKVASRWWTPVAGVALAASVAAAAILFLRIESPAQNGQLAVQAVPATSGHALVGQVGDASQLASTSTPDSYVVPKTLPRRSIVPSTQLANYVVAHSEFSSPVNRRNLLSAFMASESGTAGASSGSDEPTEDVNDDAKSPH